MIKNEVQLRGANRKLSALIDSADAAADSEERSVLRELIRQMRMNVADYEALRDGGPTSITFRSADEVGRALVAARITRGWTQAELARRLGVSEQLVQRDEHQEYEKAGLTRIADLLDELDYTMVGALRPNEEVHEYRAQTSSVSVEVRVFGELGSSTPISPRGGTTSTGASWELVAK